LGESAFRDGEDDGIGAFHWLDEGFGHAWRHVDRALLFRAGGDRQPADPPDGARAMLLPAPGKAS
jgi:hypothetical protein